MKNMIKSSLNKQTNKFCSTQFWPGLLQLCAKMRRISLKYNFLQVGTIILGVRSQVCPKYPK